ncbi:MAG: hypothetical protein M3N47_05450 [Chloroflexota bacterium]|nr:hypothetical protein [Chloroflexota bacterium]
MADDHLIIDYHRADVNVRAHVHQADSEPVLPEDAANVLEHDAEEPRRLRLRASHLNSTKAFSDFLENHSRASAHLYLFCDYEVWLKLLKLLNIRPPIPDVVEWPRES